MKKNNLKKSAPRAQKILSNPSAKGVILKSEKKENGLWLYGFAARIVKRFSVSRLVSSYGFVRRKLYTIRAAKTYNFKPKFQMLGIFKVAGLFVLFGILGFAVWQALIPQSARSKTFTFFQTAWSSVVATAVHNPDGSDQTAI